MGLRDTQLVFSLRTMTPNSWVRAGTITEIVGELSSGRTSLMTTCLRNVTAAGGTAALVDADGAFDPASATRAGVVLSRLLWVRCGGRRDAALAATDLLARCPGFVLVVLDAGETPPRVSLGAAFRLRQAARRAGVALLLVGRRRVAGPGATLALRTQRGALAWAGSRRAPTRLAGMSTCVHVIRNQGASCAPSGVADTMNERRWWTA
jgi:recombination protein RecA